MSLADELEALIAKSRLVDGSRAGVRVLHDALQLMSFVDANLSAIGAALRGRDAVLEEAATITDNSDFRWEAADAIRAMKDGKQ